MKTKEEIVANRLPRYTDTSVAEFGKYILLSNFISYVHDFARLEKAEIRGQHRPMQTVTSADGITLVNFGMGSPNAASPSSSTRPRGSTCGNFGRFSRT
jgi:AMP nucleosidase